MSPDALGILLVVCYTIFFGVLNASAISVVLPDIASELDIEFSQASWIMTGFLLVYGVAIPFYGRLADIYGARPLFILGAALFALGSLLSAIAPDFYTLLGARIIQGAGGAAAPGLGMTLSSRAYGPASRGTVLGVIGATIGIGAAIGPLLGGALSSLWGWESIFVLNAAVAFSIPFALKVLPREEASSSGGLDIVGGALLALAVVGILLAPTEGSRSGWTSIGVIAGVSLAIVSLLLLAWRERVAVAPFIPRELLRNGRFVAYGAMSFLVMAANIGVLIGLPVMLAVLNGLDAIEVGVVLVPGAVLTAITGLMAGRLVDRVGARLLAYAGGAAMIVALLGLSSVSGDSPWQISVFAGFLGAGFGLVNTPLATAVTRAVSPSLMATGVGVNSMLFFIGGGVGASVLLGISAIGQDSSLNPIHDQAGNGFSDGFLFLAVLIAAVLVLAIKPSRARS